MLETRSWAAHGLAAAFIALLAAGCAPSEQPAAEDPSVAAAPAGGKDLILTTTTSTQDSGLLDAIVPVFEQKTGYRVKTIAVGTGEALAMGGRGEADVILAHAPTLEKKYVEEGSMRNRRLIMHNDFMVVGPEEDPAGIAGMTVAADALAKLSTSGASFVSRGDNSGTNIREKSLWEAAGITPEGDWYIESGQGMGATLQIASEKNAYTLTDRGTFLARKENLALVPVVQGDPILLNLYSVMEVNPEMHEHVNNAGAVAFGDFLLDAETQATIETFGVDRFGEPLFFPDGGKTEEDLTGGN